MKKPELLAPAGNMEKLKMALIYGADAVYMGGKFFNLRAFSDNFSETELKHAVDFAHGLNKKAYVTLNIFPHNDDIELLPEYLRYLLDISVDGIIISDLGVYRIAKEVAPSLPIHVSTQANNTNWASVLFWQELGASRVVLARELSLAEIIAIRGKTSIQLEAFIHGAMCISYSGRCLLSNYLTARDANRGECAQPCRWKYTITEEKRPDQFFPIVEDDRGTYIFNSKDLCLLPHIGQLISSELDSFKIEGRMKSVHYVATVVKVYREAIDSYCNNPAQFTVKSTWLEELNKISHREYTTGFYFSERTTCNQIYGTSSYQHTHEFVGLVKEYDPITGIALVEQRNNMKLGDDIEILQPPGMDTFNQRIEAMYNDVGESISVAPHPQQLVKMPMKCKVVPNAMLRRKI